MIRVARLAAVGALAASLACASAEPGREIVWWTPSWGQARAEVLADKFEAAHPGVTVKLEVTVADGLPTRIQTALRSGSPPDLIEAQHAWVVPYAQANLLQPLDDVIEDRGDFLPASLEYDTWDGRLWAIPFRIETHALFYNRRMFREAGLDPDTPPQTWPALVDAAKTLTRTNSAGRRQYGYAITGGGEVGNTLFRTLPLMWMNGGDIVSADLSRATVNARPAVEAVTFYADMLTRHKVSPPSTLQDDGLAIRRLFVAESVAMYQSGPFDIAPIRRENPALDLGVMMLPTPTGGEPAVALGGWSFIVPKDAKQPGLARSLVRFLAESENMGYFTDTFPARRSAMALPRFADPILENFKKMLTYARRLPAHKNWLQIVQVYFDHVQRVLVGDVPAERAMNEAAIEIDRLLASP
ncbi:MAG: ABC transporter substrate-binding protein [Acidobacteria bacterium]|nr:MAG: ABC transporter substrate-binding protein [Acidobacteriota bacterium]